MVASNKAVYCIWKFPLELRSENLLSLPRGSQLLTVQEQAGELRLWALVNPLEPEEARLIEIAGTGHPLSSLYLRTYIATAQLTNGTVWHAFERIHTQT